MNARLLLVMLSLTACNGLQPVKDFAVYHLLEPLIPERPLTATTPAIAVKRPSLPGYLDRQQLVTRTNGDLILSKSDVWAEPLDAGIARVLAANLSRSTGSMNIQPTDGFSSLDYSEVLELRLTQFEADASNSMVLQGIWKRQSVSGATAPSHYFRISVPITAETTMLKNQVKAMNEALEKLARNILATK